jgi:hypothetical protein
MVGLLNAPKGTKLYNRLMNEKRLVDYGSGDNTDFTMNFIPVMGYKDLLKGYQKVVQAIYSPENYYSRVLTFFRNYKPVKTNDVKIRYCDIKAFTKSLWHLGLACEGRRYYWKMLLWALWRPQYLDSVVAFAIYGFHYRKMFEQLRPRMTELSFSNRL